MVFQPTLPQTSSDENLKHMAKSPGGVKLSIKWQEVYALFYKFSYK